VASIDIDFDRKILSQHIENRRRLANEQGLVIEIPTHYPITGAPGVAKAYQSETAQIDFISNAIAIVEPDHEFVIIDTPSALTNSNLFAHALADTIISPINDSFLDLEAIVPPPQITGEIARSPYSEVVHRAREARGLVTSRTIAWWLVPNRIFSAIDTRNERTIRMALEEARYRLNFQIARGIPERVVYRQLFAKRLTAFDPLEASLLGLQPTVSHVLARQDHRQLINLVNVRPCRASDDWRIKAEVGNARQQHRFAHHTAAE
jgi:chromosome partitioning protein